MLHTSTRRKEEKGGQESTQTKVLGLETEEGGGGAHSPHFQALSPTYSSLATVAVDFLPRLDKRESSILCESVSTIGVLLNSWWGASLRPVWH